MGQPTSPLGCSMCPGCGDREDAAGTRPGCGTYSPERLAPSCRGLDSVCGSRLVQPATLSAHRGLAALETAGRAVLPALPKLRHELADHDREGSLASLSQLW